MRIQSIDLPAIHFRVKNIAAVGLITLFVTWPCLHAVAVRTMWVNPWKLSGWGMYSTSSNQLETSMTANDAEGHIIYTRSTLPASAAQKYLQFEQKRQTLGKFVRGKDVSDLLFKLDHRVASVDINTKVLRLDSTDKYMRIFEETIHHER